jgi:hypothetical protein
MKTSRWMACRFFLCLFSMSVLIFGAQAQMLSKPTGPVVLTVGGNISQRNAGNFAEFDAEMLDNLPVTEFSTTSPWHNTSVIYSGPSLGSFSYSGASSQWQGLGDSYQGPFAHDLSV